MPARDDALHEVGSRHDIDIDHGTEQKRGAEIPKREQHGDEAGPAVSPAPEVLAGKTEVALPPYAAVEGLQPNDAALGPVWPSLRIRSVQHLN